MPTQWTHSLAFHHEGMGWYLVLVVAHVYVDLAPLGDEDDDVVMATVYEAIGDTTTLGLAGVVVLVVDGVSIVGIHKDSRPPVITYGDNDGVIGKGTLLPSQVCH